MNWKAEIARMVSEGKSQLEVIEWIRSNLSGTERNKAITYVTAGSAADDAFKNGFAPMPIPGLGLVGGVTGIGVRSPGIAGFAAGLAAPHAADKRNSGGSSAKPGNSDVLSDKELLDLAMDTFGPEMGPHMYAIAKAESSGNRKAHNDKGEDSRGLWQINIDPRANPDLAKFDLFDPTQNAAAARVVLQRQGPAAWSVFSNGMYTAYLPPGVKPLEGAGKGSTVRASGLVGEAALLAEGWIEVADGLFVEPGSGQTIDLRNDGIQNVGGHLVKIGEDGKAQVVFSPPSAPPVPRYGFQVIGGKVYSTNDITGNIQATDIEVPGFTAVEVEPSTGNLVGINNRGEFETIKEGFGFAQLDPQAVEGQRRIEAMRGFNRTGDIAAQQEEGANFRTQYGEAGSNYRTELSESGANFRNSTNAAVNVRGQNASLVAPLGALALEQSKTAADFIRNPSDFVSRGFMQRGVNSPLSTVTQSDLIRMLSEQTNATNKQIQEMPQVNAPSAPGFVRPPAYPTAPTPRTATPREVRPITAAETAQGVTPFIPTPVETQKYFLDAGVPAWATGRTPGPGAPGIPSYAGGGFTTEDMILVGEEGPELVANPDHSPLQVADTETTQRMLPQMPPVRGFASGTTGSEFFDEGSPEARYIDALAPVSTGVASSSPAVRSSGIASSSPRMTFNAQESQQGTASSNGFGTGWSLPNLPNVAVPSQAEIQAQERALRPPAVNSIMEGRRPTPLGFGFSLPTPQLLATLTPDELKAYQTSLAVQHNTTLEDVMAAQRQQFGFTQSSPAARRRF